MPLGWVRPAAIAIASLCGAAAIASWAVQTRKVRPFTRTARLLRSLSDPLIMPVERRLHRSGGNPVNAPWWLFGIGLASAFLLVTVADWVAGMLFRLEYAAGAGAGALAWFAVHLAGQLLLLALLLRVLGSWVGVGRYTPWMRPAYTVTDWIVEPIRRTIPNVGMFDISPLVAWLIIDLVLRALPR